MILVNFKLFEESFGDKAIELAKICKKVAENSKIPIVPIVSALDVYRIKNEVGIEVFVQHTDGTLTGEETGYISSIQVKLVGADGALINHSEHKLKPGTIKKLLKQWPKDFKSIVCIQSLGQTTRWAKNIKPTLIAYEPSEFIGNKEKSVSTEKPEVIKKVTEFYKDVPVLVGAGIHSKEDVKIALELGAKGILVASYVVKAMDPEKALRELVEGFAK
jgi:triosephosphate isomerase